jgi:protease II
VQPRQRSYTGVLTLWCILLFIGLLVRQATPQLAAPRAKVVPSVTTLHGEERLDEYAWLRRLSDPDVVAYLEAENLYATAMMQHTEMLQKRLYEEMVRRVQETDTTVPVQIAAE